MGINYATSHIDGGLDCSSLEIGVLKSAPDIPAIKAMIIAGKQRHPVWAIGKLALVIYSYANIAKKHYPKQLEPVQLNIFGTLVSDERGSSIIAQSVTWHTSEAIRSEAELLISQLASRSRLSAYWPTDREIMLTGIDISNRIRTD